MPASDNRSHKKRFRSDGTHVWTKPTISGPGVWVTCVRGKEKQAVGELYDLFEAIAEEIWPDDVLETKSGDDATIDGEEDIEKAMAREIESMKRPRKERRFVNCQMDTSCLIYISCKPPVDPILLVDKYMKNVEETGVTHTRVTQRLTPISGTCDVNVPEITSLCNRLVGPAFEGLEPTRYKIELRIRNHSTLTREQIIQTIAPCVPSIHKVDLTNPELFILVEVYKSVCGLSVVRDYNRYKKFNAAEVSTARGESSKTVL